VETVLLATVSVPREAVVGECRPGMVWGWNNLSGFEAQQGALVLVLEIWSVSGSAVTSWSGSRCEQYVSKWETESEAT